MSIPCFAVEFFFLFEKMSLDRCSIFCKDNNLYTYFFFSIQRKFSLLFSTASLFFILKILSKWRNLLEITFKKYFLHLVRKLQQKVWEICANAFYMNSKCLNHFKLNRNEFDEVISPPFFKYGNKNTFSSDWCLFKSTAAFFNTLIYTCVYKSYIFQNNLTFSKPS